MNKRFLAIIIAGLVALCGHAETHYVVTNNPVNPSGVDPYTSWETAGTNLIDVVTAALTNTEPRTVIVSNGTYYLTNTVIINNALTIQSVNGRETTIVNGGYPDYTNRCFYLSHAGAVVDGFTITNGCEGTENGGGVFADPGKIYNCRIIGNRLAYTPHG
ncbi:MAG: hypothetical protein PHP98_09295, partial [Kiritimatiellae bacterium]|nr:hypothetical protein [Kiritimatiellia bacterium]